MKRMRTSRAALAQELDGLRREYEEVSREQRGRIAALREENARLEEQLSRRREREASIAAALLEAERTAQAIVLRAQGQAEDILQSAQERQAAVARNTAEHEKALRELARRCKTILACMEDQLGSAATQRVFPAPAARSS